MNKKIISRILTWIFIGAVLSVCLYIMANGLGLQPELDFGAGAYYYTDIPDFDQYTEKARFQARLPYWVYLVLFLAWGALMYAAWKWIDKK
jgi:hypothetical protein